MSAAADIKHCLVAYATRDRQYLWRVELPQGASVEEALAAAREMGIEAGAGAGIRWESAAVGIFGEPCSRAHVPADGDRIEIYRPLAHDPKQARRERARRERTGRGA